MLPEGALQSRAAPGADPGCCHLDSGSRGWVMCSPRPAPQARSLAESEGEEREGAQRRDPESHQVGGGRIPSSVGTVNPASPAGESGLGELASLRGSGSVDKEEERIPRPHAVGGPCGAGGRVGGTPELRIVMGVDDNLTPSSLPSVWRRTLGGKGPDSPGSPLVLREGGIPAAREPPSLPPPPLPPGYPFLCSRGIAPPGSPPPARRRETARCSGPGLRPESGHAALPAPGSIPGGGSGWSGAWAAV